ncbi:MAG: glucose-1-phosphate adenylyltransferase [Elusimicrobiota bacterium]
MVLPETLVVLLAGGRGERLGPLTEQRAKPAVPFGGLYRIVDFAVSNCINSGLTRILVLVQYRARSLNRHIRQGLSVYFNPARGEFIESLSPQQQKGEQWFQGTADAVYQNIFAIREANPEAVLVLSGDHIYKMDYRRMLRFHTELRADVTVGAVEMPRSQVSGFGVLQVDNEERIVRFQEKPKDPNPIPGDPNLCLASMGIYVFRPEVLERVLEADAADPQSNHDFGRDIIPKLIGHCALYAFRFIDENKKAAKYWRDVGTVEAYYWANMDLVSIDPQLNLYDFEWPLHTSPLTAPPAKFVFGDEHPGGRMGQSIDSLVSPGCIISGGRVFRSVLSQFVRVNSFAVVEDSVVFENVQIGRHARVRRAIIDKDVRVPEGMVIGHDIEEDRRRFTVTDSGIVVISKGAEL